MTALGAPPRTIEQEEGFSLGLQAEKSGGQFEVGICIIPSDWTYHFEPCINDNDEQ